MVVYQALTWESRDVEEDHMVSIFGKSEDGDSVCVTTIFRPYFFIKLGKNDSESVIFQNIRELVNGNIMSYEVVRFKDLWGFQNNEKYLYLKLNFKSLVHMKKCDSKLRYSKNAMGLPYKVYESNIEPVLRFMHRTGIQSTGWLDTGLSCSRSNISRADIDLYCSDWKTLTPVSRDDNAPFIVCSFDIECNSSTGKFPDPKIQDDCCFQIALTLRFLGSEEIYDKTCLCYKQTDDKLEGCNIISFDTEREMLMAFNEYVNGHDIDIMTGWNIFGFDLEYIYTRAVKCKCPFEFFQLGKLKDQECEIVKKKLSSSALGDNLLKILPMSGRFIFDFFHEVKREKKLDSYSLNFVSEKFLGDKKIDMPPKEMFKRFVEGDPKKLMEVAEYCIKDTILPHRLLDKLCTLLNLIEMAKATWVPISYLSERGQQIKVFSQMTRKARELKFMVPTIRYGAIEFDGYEGATVLEAHKGAYYTPITALDFEGLYPSIMMAHNLCYSSLVMDPKYDNLPGVTYESFEIGNNTYRFAQDVPSLLPEILAELKKFRKLAKKDMANSSGDMQKVYNGKQLAYKISMNSVYGFTGAGKGMLPCVPIAATVTAEGRHMIEQTKEHVENNFPGSIVRYGDSVTPDTPLVIRSNGVVKTCRIDSLVNEYQDRSDGKEIAILEGVEVWTDQGFTPIKQVVRHLTSKKMYRVLTHTGVVDCTEDHSLLLPDASKISPENVNIHTELLHGDSVKAFTSEDLSVSLEEAKVMGFFYGDGSCGSYNCRSGLKHTWALNNSNLDYLIEMQNLCPFETTLYDTIDSSGVYKLNAKGDVKNVVHKYRSLFYNKHNEKVVPSCILNAPLDIVNAFVDGYYMADGDKDVNRYIRMDNKGKEGTTGLFLLGRRMGYNVSLNSREDKSNIFRQTWTFEKQRRNPVAIKKIVYMGKTDEYVYDLTTESHHFAVGPGDMVVHNTDSVMVEFDVEGRTGEDAIKYSWELGEKAAEMCNGLFKKPKNLELEKVYCPYYLYSKKRYAAKLWTMRKDGNMQMEYTDVKGLQVVRRDNTLHAREVCKELIDVLMNSNDPETAKEVARSRAQELLEGKVPMEKLVLSQTLADSYKSDNLSHVMVRNKMREREPGSEPQSGDRVPYILVKTEDPKAKAYEKAEDPKWALANNIKPDYEYYLTNKFMNPICDLLEPIVENPKAEIFENILPKKPSKRKTVQKTKIDSFFKPI